MPLFGMREVFFAPTQKATPYIIQAIDATTQNGAIIMEGSFVNNTGVIEALKKAKSRGVALQLLVAKKKENKVLEDDFKECLYLHHGMHTKRCIVCKDSNPVDNDGLIAGDVVVVTGSENQSNNAGTHHEYTIIERDKKLVTKHYNDFLFNLSLAQSFKKEYVKPEKISESNKENVPLSPRSPRIYNSQRFRSSALKAARIAKLVPKGMVEKIYVSSMGFDQPKVAQALIEKVGTGSKVLLILHRDAIKQRNRAMIKQMHDAGVDVRIWQGSKIQHTKLLVRERIMHDGAETDDVLCVTSTGNLVKQSDTEINYDLVIPKNKKCALTLRDYLVKLASKCTPYNEVDFVAFDKKYTKSKKEKCAGPKDAFHFYLPCPECDQSFERLLKGLLISSYLRHRKEKHKSSQIEEEAVKDFIESHIVLAKKFKKYKLICPQDNCGDMFYSSSSPSKVKASLVRHLKTQKHELSEKVAKEITKPLEPIIEICENPLSK